jgi:polar amino acid transport system substrate-binding protein
VRIRKTSLAALAAVIGLAACGSDKDETASGESKAPTSAASGSEAMDCKPIKAGVLTVVTSLPGPNFWGTGEADPGAIKSGIEFDLATKIAEKCGLKMEFRNENFDAIVAGQIAGDSYDIALSQVTITEERDKVVDFSVPYFKADQGVLVKKGTAIGSFADLAALKVGVQASTTAEYYFSSAAEANQWKLGADAQSFPDLTSAYAALDAGQVEAVVIDTAINLGQAAKSNGALEVPAQIITGEEYGAIYPEGSAKKAIFDGIIKGFNDDGTTNGLIAQYLGGDPSKVPVITVK